MTTKGDPKNNPQRPQGYGADGPGGGRSSEDAAEQAICPFTQRNRDAETRKYRECSDIKTVLIRFQ